MKTYKNVITYVEKSMISDSLCFIGLIMTLLSNFFNDVIGLVLNIIALLLLGCSWSVGSKKDREMIKFVSADYFKYSSIINMMFFLLIIVSLFKTNKYMIVGTIMGVIGLIINGILEIRYLKKTKPEISETNTTRE